MKKKVFGIILATFLFGSLLTGCAAKFPETPFDAVFAIQQDDSLYLTNEYPCITEGYVEVSNYWWREYDEEGNTEWLRRTEDWYYILLDPRAGAITFRSIKDGQIADTVEMYKGKR